MHQQLFTRLPLLLSLWLSWKIYAIPTANRGTKIETILRRIVKSESSLIFRFIFVVHLTSKPQLFMLAVQFNDKYIRYFLLRSIRWRRQMEGGCSCNEQLTIVTYKLWIRCTRLHILVSCVIVFDVTFHQIFTSLMQTVSINS